MAEERWRRRDGKKVGKKKKNGREWTRADVVSGIWRRRRLVTRRRGSSVKSENRRAASNKYAGRPAFLSLHSSCLTEQHRQLHSSSSRRRKTYHRINNMGVAFKFGLALSACVCLALADPIPAASRSHDDGCAHSDDAIACAQIQMFKTVRSFFDQDKVDLFGGLSLIKTEKKGRSLAQDAAEDVSKIENAKDSNERETALEDFTMHKVMRFFQERSLHWNLSPVVTEVSETARSVVDQLPNQIKSKISDFIEEGRGMKKKKLMKQLFPFLIALKVKLAAFAALAYVVIALIAKKALLASLISLLVSGFIGIKKLLASQHHAPHHEVVETHHAAHPSYGSSAPSGYSASSSGWDSYGGAGGHDAHGSYSNNVAQTLAYGGQKPASR